MADFVYSRNFQQVPKPLVISGGRVAGDIELKGVEIKEDLKVVGGATIGEDLVVEGDLYVLNEVNIDDALITLGANLPSDNQVGGVQIVSTAGVSEAGLYRYPASISGSGFTEFYLADGVPSLTAPAVPPDEADVSSNLAKISVGEIYAGGDIKTPQNVEAKDVVATGSIQAPNVYATTISNIVGAPLTIIDSNASGTKFQSAGEFNFFRPTTLEGFSFRFTSDVATPHFRIGSADVQALVPISVPTFSSFRFVDSQRGLFDFNTYVALRCAGLDNLQVSASEVVSQVPIRTSNVASSLQFANGDKGVFATGSNLTLKVGGTDSLTINDVDPTVVEAKKFSAGIVDTPILARTDTGALTIQASDGDAIMEAITSGSDIEIRALLGKVTISTGGAPRLEITDAETKILNAFTLTEIKNCSLLEGPAATTLTVRSLQDMVVESKNGATTITSTTTSTLQGSNQVSLNVGLAEKFRSTATQSISFNPLIVPIADLTTPGLQIGDASVGFYRNGTNGLAAKSDGALLFEQKSSGPSDVLELNTALKFVDSTLNSRYIEGPIDIIGDPTNGMQISNVNVVYWGNTNTPSTDTRRNVMTFRSAAAISSNRLLKIVNVGGEARVSTLLASDPDGDVPCIGVSVNSAGAAGQDVTVCVGPIFDIAVENGVTINIGDPCDSSPNVGQDGRIGAYAVNEGHIGVALTSGTGNVSGTVTVKVMRPITEAF